MAKRFRVNYKGISAQKGQPVTGGLIVVPTFIEDPTRADIVRMAQKSIRENEPDTQDVEITTIWELD